MKCEFWCLAELRNLVIKYFDGETVCSGMAVSRSWREIFDDSEYELWRCICATTMPFLLQACPDIPSSTRDWAGLFRAVSQCRKLHPDKYDTPISREPKIEPAEYDERRFLIIAIVNDVYAGRINPSSGAWELSDDTIPFQDTTEKEKKNEVDQSKEERSHQYTQVSIPRLRCSLTQVSLSNEKSLLIPNNLSLRIICIDVVTMRAVQLVHDRVMMHAEVLASQMLNEDGYSMSFARAGDIVSYGSEFNYFVKNREHFVSETMRSFVGFVELRRLSTIDSELQLVAAGFELAIENQHTFEVPDLRRDLWRLCNTTSDISSPALALAQ